jgi:hypothetical protein
MKSVEEMIRQYKMMEQVVPSSSMLREVRFQYADMAAGGNGGDIGYMPDLGRHTTCREYNYPHKSDSYFKAIITGMGW